MNKIAAGGRRGALAARRTIGRDIRSRDARDVAAQHALSAARSARA
ncbi:hypothetical protein C7S16_0656 [Burkholderia thailandensis]|uniref:Uncharacterized protein n=1 Tax=Burkholderia thailandensis TaxID=57975 RepID=A0AAW9D5Q0_BURTH|nr:hypothetical protein [Burkholderia thailandensis]MDW9257092.1 hypothetical protein [Burkholderia thailandensis]